LQQLGWGELEGGARTPKSLNHCARRLGTLDLSDRSGVLDGHPVLGLPEATHLRIRALPLS
jgi:hypothetical protein